MTTEENKLKWQEFSFGERWSGVAKNWTRWPANSIKYFSEMYELSRKTEDWMDEEEVYCKNLRSCYHTGSEWRGA